MIHALVIMALFLIVVMSVTWWLSVCWHNAGIVDIVWAAAFTPMVWIAAWMNHGDRTRALIVVSMVTLWSLRLAGHLFVRVKSHHPVEDGRYAALRQRWGARANWNMFTFFHLQGLLILILAFPWLLVCRNPWPLLHLSEWLGMVLWIVAFLGESAADLQLKAFKALPSHRGQVCQVGLWRYSRHPNYFFEWLNWVSFALFALGSPWGWIAWYAPALMLYFLLRVTGIPATEQQALQTKGELYRTYQRATPSAFVPWFPGKL